MDRFPINGGKMDLFGMVSMLSMYAVLFFQVGWYVFVPYMLWMIWQKVRHLPS